MRSLFSFCLAMIACGCATKTPPLSAPLVAVDQTIYSGSPLTGPTTAAVDTSRADSAIVCSVRLLALDAVPSEGFSPLGSDVRIILATRDDGEVQPTGRMIQRVRSA